MNEAQEEEDGDGVDIEAAARWRRTLMRQVRQRPDPLHQALMEIEQLGEPFFLSESLNYDDDVSDLE